MNKNKDTTHKYQEGLFTAISAGFFFLLIGIIFVVTPNLFDGIINFIDNFGLVNVPNTNIIVPAPEIQRAHLTVYEAAGQFSIALAIFQIVVLALRFVIPSSWEKRSETVGNFIYWTGSAYLIQLFLIDTTQWFTFWSTIIIVIGFSLIVRAAVMAISRI